MTDYAEPTADDPWILLPGDCQETLRSIPKRTVDAVVCDPPYGLSFMGKDWDHEVPGPDYWRRAYVRLKPGGYLVAFAGSRTYHRMACAIEDAGFEIRDQLMWLYGSGFPKSLDVSKAIDKAAGAVREVVGYDATKARPNKENFAKRTDRQPSAGAVEGWKDNGATITAPSTDAAKQWEGWGTALKPAHEPIVLARKPLSEGTVTANVLRWGTGALNVDACRIGGTPPLCWPKARGMGYLSKGKYESPTSSLVPSAKGRFPANVALDEAAAEQLDAQSGQLKSGSNNTRRREGQFGAGDSQHGGLGKAGDVQTSYGDTGGASRFYYCAKATKADRAGSMHPTVKPVALMRWLVRLVCPPGGLVLDPFAGSGTTGQAALAEGMRVILCEREELYCTDIRTRLSALRTAG